MAYCYKCGSQIQDEAVICPHCGVAQPNKTASQDDTGNFGWSALGCCIPVVGLVLYLVWKDTKPNNAKKAGVGALVSVILGVILYIIAIVFGVSESMMYY